MGPILSLELAFNIHCICVWLRYLSLYVTSYLCLVQNSPKLGTSMTCRPTAQNVGKISRPTAGALLFSSFEPVQCCQYNFATLCLNLKCIHKILVTGELWSTKVMLFNYFIYNSPTHLSQQPGCPVNSANLTRWKKPEFFVPVQSVVRYPTGSDTSQVAAPRSYHTKTIMVEGLNGKTALFINITFTPVAT